MPAPTDNRIRLSPEQELNRIITLEQAAELCSLSADTIQRRWPEKLVQLSPRRIGIRVRDALMLPITTA
jgi:hypothetical protein